MKERLKNIILENQFRELPEIFLRQIEIPIDTPIIISLIGSRRSGKTYLLYQTLKKLYELGTDIRQIVFINFEDERLTLRSEDLDLIVQAYTELYPQQKIEDTYFFFDEIQNIKGWEKFVRRMFDTYSRHIFITGSNSKLLSSEIATELRGRTLTFTVYPLSLSEYLDFHGIEKQLYPAKNKGKIIHYTEKFLSEGGFPESVFWDTKIRTMLMQQYFNVMIFRDIVERYNVGNVEVLKFFIKKIFAGITKPFSVNKAYNDIRSMGYKISNKYLYDYLDYCNAVFLGIEVNKFDFSEIKQEKSDKKVYAIDTGLLSAVEFSISRNKGKLLENMFAMELIKMGYTVFYFRNNFECDFVCSFDNVWACFQVSWSIDAPETLNRELRGLSEACSTLNLKKGTIITFDTETDMVYNELEVQVIPVYKFLMNNLI